MTSPPLPFDVIATRILDVLDDAGSASRQLEVRMGRPRIEPTGEWAIAYQVVGLDQDAVYTVFGFDAIQAFQAALLVIGGLLAGLDEAKQGRLRWAGDPDLGFPQPPSAFKL